MPEVRKSPRAWACARGGVAPALLILIGIALGVGLYTFRYAEGLSYLSNDPRACVNCHVMRDHYDGWQKASHHAVATCNDCHVPVDFFGRYATKIEHGWRHSKGFTLQDFHEPIRITDGSLAVVERNCLRCHGDLLRDAHFGVDASLGCVHCHDAAGHGPRR